MLYKIEVFTLYNSCFKRALQDLTKIRNLRPDWCACQNSTVKLSFLKHVKWVRFVFCGKDDSFDNPTREWIEKGKSYLKQIKPEENFTVCFAKEADREHVKTVIKRDTRCGLVLLGEKDIDFEFKSHDCMACLSTGANLEQSIDRLLMRYVLRLLSIVALDSGYDVSSNMEGRLIFSAVIKSRLETRCALIWSLLLRFEGKGELFGN